MTLRPEVINELSKWYSAEDLNALQERLSTPPAWTTVRCNTLVSSPRDLRDFLNIKLGYHVLSNSLGENFKFSNDFLAGVIFRLLQS
jgi:hypothetical protein